MRKCLALMLSALLVLGLAACGTQPTGEAAPAPALPAEEPELPAQTEEEPAAPAEEPEEPAEQQEAPEPEEDLPGEEPLPADETVPETDTESAPQEPAPAEEEASLTELRELTRSINAVCAAAYVAFYDISVGTDLRNFLEPAGYDEAYPFTAKIPETQVIDYPGEDIYCIVPEERDAVVTVSELVWDEEAEELVTGVGLYSGDGAPVLLRCNVSDIMPNILVHIELADGRTLDYSPTLSLRDGNLAVPEDGSVLDFGLMHNTEE